MWNNESFLNCLLLYIIKFMFVSKYNISKWNAHNLVDSVLMLMICFCSCVFADGESSSSRKGSPSCHFFQTSQHHWRWYWEAAPSSGSWLNAIFVLMFKLETCETLILIARDCFRYIFLFQCYRCSTGCTSSHTYTHFNALTYGGMQRDIMLNTYSTIP